jgi:lysophospholipase L1-like esterase
VHKRFLAILAAVACAVGLAGATAVPAQAATAPNLRILPLGDSITWGIGTSDNSSYRAELYKQITNGGHNLDFVGSQRSGNLPDPDNEGHSGWRIDQIQGIANCTLAGYRPNIVTLHIGTNDMGQNYDPAGAPARLGALIDQILAAAPDTTVLVANLILSTDSATGARVKTFNTQVPGIVSTRKNAGKHVQLVDMSALTAADMSDTLHPNANGYAKMATAFNAGVNQVLSFGWVKEPVAAAGNGNCTGAAPLRGQESGRCVDLPGGASTNGTAVALWDCNNGTNQQWVATGTKQLQSLGKCLDATGHGTADGTAVVLWDCNGGSNQQWTLNSDGTVVGVESGKCLDVFAHNTANGSKLSLWTCNGGANQKFSRS